MSTKELSPNIFNTHKSDYQNPSMFLGQPMGLFDTINKRYPRNWELYKKLKALDWDEDEFDFASCNVEFKTCPRNVYDMMIRTLAWQWEADSIVARTIAPVVAPFVTSTEIWTGWQRISDNESIHALTYSEIVRLSFDDPDLVLGEILSVVESLSRLTTFGEIMNETYVVSHKLALGEIDRNSQEAYNAIFMFTVAMLCLERIQFIASFAITFSIANSGLFIPIGKAVQKIAQDEIEIHVEWDKAILRHEMTTEKGRIAYEQCYSKIQQLVDEVVDSELNWVEYLFSEGRELVGVTPELLKKWVLWSAKSVYTFLNVQPKHAIPERNPLGFMDDWIRNDHQISPQEEKGVAYMLGAVQDDLGSEVIDIEL